MRRTIAALAATLLAFLLSLSPVAAQSNWPTPGGANVDGKVEMCLNSSSQAVPCSASGAIPNAVTATQQTGATTQAKVTISVTNTYQQALASSATRKGCTIQYIAVVGTKGYVFFGSAPADTTTSFQLTNGQAISCNAAGVTLTDAVQVTATGTDIFVVSNQ